MDQGQQNSKRFQQESEQRQKEFEQKEQEVNLTVISYFSRERQRLLSNAKISSDHPWLLVPLDGFQIRAIGVHLEFEVKSDAHFIEHFPIGLN